MANKWKSGKRADRLRAMAEDLALDMTIRRIAERHGVSTATAFNDVQQIKADWLESRNDTLEQARAIQSARLVRFIREMWDAWFESKGFQFKIREKQIPGAPEQVQGIVIAGDGRSMLTELLTPGEPVTIETIKQSYYSPGNPRFAEQILGAYDQLAKIQGLYAVKEIHLNITRYLQQVAEELGIDADELIREAEDVAEAAWKASEAKP